MRTFSRTRIILVVSAASALTIAALAALRFAPLHLQITPLATTLPADGAFHPAALLRVEHNLTLAPPDIATSGLSTRLRTEDLHTLSLAIRAPVLPGTHSVVVRYRNSSRTLTLHFALDTQDTFADGTPDFLRLHTAADRAAFRVWFTALAANAAALPPANLPKELNDCAALLRWCYRNALHAHDEPWLATLPPGIVLLPAEQIDERTLIEKFHDWKASVWDTIREFFRHQFSHHARAQIRAHQSSIERHSRIVSEAEFAQVPLLNRSQLVAHWRQLTPSTFFSDHNLLPLQKLSPGLYLLEATDGHLKAYTLVMVSDIALVARTSDTGVLAFVVDRNSGQPIAGATVQSGIGQHQLATATTDADGVAALPALTDKSSPDNFYVFASSGAQFAASTPSTWSMTFDTSSKLSGYAFTERPVYRPTHTVHWKAIFREHSGNALVLPKEKTAHVVISDENDKAVFERDMPISSEGDIVGDYTLAADASLGYYTLRIGGQQYGGISTGFHVEDYRKPEYRVSVVSKDKRVLEGQTATVTIDSRYFFGEPVANGKVKYRVYHERNRGWFGDEDDSDDDDTAAANAYQAPRKTPITSATKKPRRQASWTPTVS